MKTHTIELCRKNLHGTFCNSTQPIIRIASGDSVVCSVMDGDWHMAKPTVPQSNAGALYSERDPKTDYGHALIGPIYVDGAKPGTTLAIRINENHPANWGWSRVGGMESDHTQRLGIEKDSEFFLIWDLDLEKMLGVSHMGHVVRLSPFLGVLGVAPAEGGYHSTHPPRACGGNFDCKCLVPGTTLYLPVFCEGALFYVGDGHALQGDGELGGTAIECPMDRIDLTLSVIKNMHINMPRACTPEGWVTFGFDKDLTLASYQALHEMTLLIGEQYGVGKKEALAYASLVVDERVTQIVNGVRGIHAVLPHGAIYRLQK